MKKLGQHAGIIFDLDGTLVDSKLDFSVLCQQLGWPEGTPILEYLQTLHCVEEKKRAEQIIRNFELTAAKTASWMPNAQRLLQHLRDKKIPTAILTRNYKAATQLCIQQLAIPIDLVLTREDCAPKPDPAGLLLIAQQWQLPCQDLLFVGDYLFDLQTASNAGMPSCLLRQPDNAHFSAVASFVIDDFLELHQSYR